MLLKSKKPDQFPGRACDDWRCSGADLVPVHIGIMFLKNAGIGYRNSVGRSGLAGISYGRWISIFKALVATDGSDQGLLQAVDNL